MIVEKLDHVNIIAHDLDATARFYADLLDLEERDGPPSMRREEARWMFDSAGNAILHLNSPDCRRLFDRPVKDGEATGALHHVALRCSGFGTVKSRLDARGADYQVNDASSAGIRQIFTFDPNNVLLELNFFSEGSPLD